MEQCASGKPAGRIYFIDYIRALAIIYMVFFHLIFDLSYIWSVEWAERIYVSQLSVVVFDGATFILLSGISSHFSRSNAQRGARLLCIALCFTAVTAFIFPGAAIYFGILHLLSFSMLIYAAVQKWLDKIPWWATLLICAVLFAVTYNIFDGVIGIKGLFEIALPRELTANNNLYPFGIIRAGYYSADYFPLMPWLFLFLAGTSLGRLFCRELPPALYKNPVPALGFIGRHSLFIYVVHQPLIFAVLFIIFKIIGLSD